MTSNRAKQNQTVLTHLAKHQVALIPSNKKQQARKKSNTKRRGNKYSEDFQFQNDNLYQQLKQMGQEAPESIVNHGSTDFEKILTSSQNPLAGVSFNKNDG